MSVSRTFVLDTNTLIEAKNRYYGFDICPGFWSSLLEQHNSGRLHSIDRVKAELLRQEDELTAWVRDQAPATFFLPHRYARDIREIQSINELGLCASNVLSRGKERVREKRRRMVDRSRCGEWARCRDARAILGSCKKENADP